MFNHKKTMQMKKVTFLLAIFALAASTSLKAIELPEVSKDGKVKWYFLQTVATDDRIDRVFTVEGDWLFGRYKADYSDYETLSKQLWCFEQVDGEWYTVINRYDGRKLDIMNNPNLYNWESCGVTDNPRALFKFRDVNGELGLESSVGAPSDGANMFRFPTLATEGNFCVWVIRESFAGAPECSFRLIEYNDTYAIDEEGKIGWFNIKSAREVNDGEVIVDNTSVVDAKYKFTVEKKETTDYNAQWRLDESQSGKTVLINRATGNSISTSLTADGRYNFPEAGGKDAEATAWNLLPVSETQYIISSKGDDGRTRMLNAQTLGEDPFEVTDENPAGTSVAWTFEKVDTSVGIDEATATQPESIKVENGRVIAPAGAKITVTTPEGIVIPATSHLTPGIYIITVDGKTSKILVH